ncbi:MAG TPA: TlpA disulfide reductase family protein [Bryobacteraceae bacterium]|nr:TlpA disulfide reductase family protein [Bryobacteraceae bacterium]
MSVFALGIGATALVSPAATPQNLDGRWAATITEGGITIPFRLDISGSGDKLTGKLYNGDNDFETTTSASFENGTLHLNFLHYLTSISAQVQNGDLDGQLIVTRRSAIIITPGQSPESKPKDVASPFHATRYIAPTAAAVANVPNIDGIWEIPHDSPKGEKSWRLIVQQKGPEIETTVLRVDGDTGALTGSWQDGKFVASHFDGARPGLILLTPQKDGSLSVVLRAEPRNLEFTAYRPEVARAKGFPEPANYLTHTTVRDPNEVFAYNFPDVHGQLLSNESSKFKGKAVLAIVTGTWCPNCHDEAKYLVELYNKYHAKGLEIVALDFEEADQKASLTRVNAFISQYKIPYTYLIAGTPDEMWDKVPQAVNLNTWPATFFIGKDGRVKATYSGFAGAASGPYNTELKHEFTSIIDKLLAENDQDLRASN